MDGLTQTQSQQSEVLSNIELVFKQAIKVLRYSFSIVVIVCLAYNCLWNEGSSQNMALTLSGLQMHFTH